MLNTLLASNPGFTCCSRRIELIIKPAPTSNTIASATSATARPCRAQPARLSAHLSLTFSQHQIQVRPRRLYRRTQSEQHRRQQ